MATIHNMTPHTITLIVEGVRVDFPSEGIIRAKQEDTKVDEIVTDLNLGNSSAGFTIPVFSSKFFEPEGVPELKDDTIYIVSSLAFQSLKAHGYNMKYFVIPSGTIRDESGKIIGCKGFARI